MFKKQISIQIGTVMLPINLIEFTIMSRHEIAIIPHQFIITGHSLPLRVDVPVKRDRKGLTVYCLANLPKPSLSKKPQVHWTVLLNGALNLSNPEAL